MAIPHTNQNYSSGYLKPKDDIDPNKKQGNPQYSLDFSKFIYSQYQKDSSAIKSDMADIFIRNRSYARGEQDTSQYKDWIFGTDEQVAPEIPYAYNSDTTAIVSDLKQEDLGIDNINWDDVFSPLPKYVENIIGLMQSQYHDININAVDENSGSMREEMKFRSYIEQQLKAVITRFNAAFDIPDMNEQSQVRPKSLDELELFANIGAFKLPYEIAMEKAILDSLNESYFDDELKDDIIRDLFVDGYASIVVQQDPSDGKFKCERKDVLDIILEDSRKNDFSDATWGGYVEYYTIHKLRIDTGWSEDDLKKLAESVTGVYGNPENFDYSKRNGQFWYDDFRVPVLHSFWKTIDTEYYSKRETKVGPKEFYEPYRGNGLKPPKKKNGRDLNKVAIRRTYHARWVVDTEKVFDYGIAPNAPYNFGINDTEFPIKLYKTKGKPKLESMIPIEDQIYLTFIKTQNAIAKAAPPGLAIEWGSIQNISYGKKKLAPKDSIRLYTHSGNIVYQLDVKTIPGQYGSKQVGRPIEELKGGLGTAIADGIQGIEFLYRQLDIITGIDAITSATSMPDRDTGKAVTEMAMASTSNTLKPIYSGFIRLKVSAAKVIVWQMQALTTSYGAKELNKHPYYHSLGYGNLLAIKSAGDFPPVIYGFKVEARATDSEKQQIMAAAQAGLAGGKNGVPALTFSEFSFIMRYLNTGKSIKYLELWLAQKEREREEKEAQRQKENIAAQGKEQKELVEVQAKAEQDKIMWEKEKNIEIERIKGEEERKTLLLKYENEKELTLLEASVSKKESTNPQNN